MPRLIWIRSLERNRDFAQSPVQENSVQAKMVGKYYLYFSCCVIENRVSLLTYTLSLVRLISPLSQMRAYVRRVWVRRRRVFVRGAFACKKYRVRFTALLLVKL